MTAIMIERKVGSDSKKNSNLFLRSLWAELRTRFGAMGWQYTPRRYGNIKQIRFGWVTLGDTSRETIEIGISYKKRGIVDVIYFDPKCKEEEIHPQFHVLVNDSIDAALRVHNSPPELTRVMRVTSRPTAPIAYYRSKNWYTGPLSDGSTEIGITVRAFDEVDLDYEFKSKARMLLNMLAVWTNCAFEIDNSSQPEILEAAPGEPWTDTDWLDDHPLANRLLQLEDNQLYYGDLISRDMIEHDNNLSRAAHHFAEGLRFLRWGSSEFYNLSTVHLVSSLEVISLPEDGTTPSCSECGQPIYRISKRVVDFGVGHLGAGAERILKASYAKRSRYLHTGGSDAAQPFTSRAIPMLDPSAPEGCAMPETIEYPINLMEFTSFAIRAEVRQYIKSLKSN
ncbi:hypothetical protein [Methylorubrum populi]|uniref:hypothetical protein n=1 Tax=Methylorubrum populi TaxID=223967 RepID=UPI003F65E0A9